MASISVTVIADWLTPSAVTADGEALMVDSDTDAAPGTSWICAEFVPIALSMTGRSVATPAVVGATKVAVYVPSPLSVAVETEPVSIAMLMSAPPTPTRLP